MALDETKMALASFFTVSLFYPLLVPFYGPAILIFLLAKYRNWVLKRINLISYSAITLILILPVLFLILIISPLTDKISLALSRLFYTSFSGDFIPNFNIFYIVPLFAIIFAIAGLPYVFKNKKWLFWNLIIGVFYWILYMFTINRFIIEFERAVLFTSIIIILISGFGLSQLEDYVALRFKKMGVKILKFAQIFIIIIFLCLIPWYTKGENGLSLTLESPDGQYTIYPKAVANNYLNTDDLKLFTGIMHKRFLSSPWKGTVIGISTNNYPLITKGGTISIGSQATIDYFLKADCKGRMNIAKLWNLDYIYLNAFNCPGFEKIGQSQEGFVLYKVIK